VSIVQPPSGPSFVVDVGAIAKPDPRTLDALVRLQLAARRSGVSIRLRNACEELVNLLALVGLSDVLPLVVESGVVESGEVESGGEVGRLVEEGKQLLVDEVVDPGDAAV
jgi:STAS domain